MIKEHERGVNCVVAYAHADRRERVIVLERKEHHVCFPKRV